jgi:hypothetical protein
MPHPTGSEILSVNQLAQFRFAKPEQVRSLEREQQELSWALNGRSQYDGELLFGELMPERLQGGTAPDQDHVRTLMEKNKATLAASRPPTDLTPMQRSKYAALERDLRQEIQEGMLSNDMTNNPTEYNIDMELAWQYHKSKKAIAWMNVRQMLDPTNDSPFFTSIEALRPTNPPTVDLRKLRQNWDNIAFTDAMERAEIEIDDALYSQFLRYKAMDWSDKGIMRELGLSRAGLEVAMARLMAERLEASEPEMDEDDEDEGETYGSPASPGSSEVDEEADEEEELVSASPRASATLPAGVVPPQTLETPHAKGTWLRAQLERRHMTVRGLGNALGLTGSPLSVFQVKVSKGSRLTDDEWQSIGLILAQADDDPAFLARYADEKSWAHGRHTAKDTNAKSRRYGNR